MDEYPDAKAGRAPGGVIRLYRGSLTAAVTAGRGKRAVRVRLTKKEFEVLYMLVTREGRVISRQAMLERLYGGEADRVFPASIDRHITTLRRKLGAAAVWIRTVYGTGYALLTEGK